MYYVILYSDYVILQGNKGNVIVVCVMYGLCNNTRYDAVDYYATI